MFRSKCAFVLLVPVAVLGLAAPAAAADPPPKAEIGVSYSVLTGVGNVGAGVEGMTMSVTAFAVQTGGGVDIRMGARASLRVQGDYRLLRKYGENLNEFRFAVGVVFGAGKR